MTHILVPKHELLDDKKTAKLLKEYDITIAQLPKIPAGDPALGGMDAKVGDVIKIDRKSPTTGKSIYYRVVI